MSAAMKLKDAYSLEESYDQPRQRIHGNDDPVYKTAKETQMCRADFWTQRERERVG